VGQKERNSDSDPALNNLAMAIMYLADQIRSGCADIADGLRQGSPRAPSVQIENHQMSNEKQSQDKKTEGLSWKYGQDEIPDMRDDDPLPNFGRRAG
jgi:hypothetical protein